jgi:hypothetical protein
MKHILLFLFFSSYIFFSSHLFALDKCSTEEKDSISSMDELLSYRTHPEFISKEITSERKHYKKYLYTIKAQNQDKEEITKFYYYHTNKGVGVKKPTVFLFSNVGGITILERYIGFYLAKRGISTVVVELDDIKNVDRLEKVSPYLVSSLFSSMNIVDFIADEPYTDKDKLATIGVSLGGFRALYLSAIDTRIKSATLVVSGLSITETIASSTLEMVEEIRSEQMRAVGLDPLQDKADYELLLKQQIMFNVEDLLCRKNPENYLLFQSKNDTIVPYSEQNRLYEALKKPKRTLSNHFGHKATAIGFGMTKLGDTVKFMYSNW